MISESKSKNNFVKYISLVFAIQAKALVKIPFNRIRGLINALFLLPPAQITPL